MKRARLVSLTLAAALVLSVAACGGAPTEIESGHAGERAAAPTAAPSSQNGSAIAVPDKVKRAAAIAKEIQANPDATAKILQREGLTVEAFEDLLYEIAANPDMSAAYERELGG